jgi:copper homeostasis protein
MPQARPFTLEVCIDTADGIAACQTHADRIELCAALAAGGLTPSFGLMELARTSGVPVHAMVRPRAGDFEYSNNEVTACLGDIKAAQRAGLAGVVLGASKGGELDMKALSAMCDAAAGIDRTLHRVVDCLADPILAIEQAIDLGFVRILTSGGARGAADGIARLTAMQKAASGRIEIMVGSGVTPQTAALIAKATGIRSFHASCAGDIAQGEGEQSLGFSEPTRRVTDLDAIARLRAALDQIAT